MNRYPLWKNILVAAALLLGFLYTLPNFFTSTPAVQVAPLGPTAAVDQAFVARVEGILKQANIAQRGVALDGNSIKARFADTDTQIKAKDILTKALNPDAQNAVYTVALNMVSNVPRWLLAIGAKPMYLGLDLRGGVHFLLQVDMKAALDKKVDVFGRDVRQLMRSKDIRYAGVQRNGQIAIVRFNDAQLRERARTEIEKVYSEFNLKDEQDGAEFRLVATLKPEAETQVRDYALQQNITTLHNRVNELGVAEPTIQQQGADRVVVQLPGVQDTARAKEILGRTATLEVRMVDEEHDLQAAVQGQIPFGSELLYERPRQPGEQAIPILIKKEVVLTGDTITDAAPGFDSTSGRPAVHISLDGKGARIFHQVTRENVKKRMAMLLIEKNKAEVITAPTIQEEIGGGRVQITGMRDTREANDVSLLLRAGSLAAPMEIIEERTIGPSLGADNIAKGFNSTVGGFAAIAVFMSIYYMLFGLVSVLALAANLLFLVAILSALQATLTLPGMAGIALTLGMAIDANVLINERIREELRNGNSPHNAINAGYERAFGTILDSNITTLIAGIALFAFGSGPVRGFAVVLCLGILTSMFSSVVVSRALVNLIYGGRRKIERLSIGNTKWKEDDPARRAPA